MINKKVSDILHARTVVFTLLPVAIEVSELNPFSGIRLVGGHQVLNSLDVDPVAIEGLPQFANQIFQSVHFRYGQHSLLDFNIIATRSETGSIINLGHCFN